MPDRPVQRVLMTGDTVGGVWTFTMELAGELARQGVEVLLAVMGGPPQEHQRAEAARIPNLQLAASNYKLEWMEDPWDDVEESGRWLLALEKEFVPDLIHLNTFGHGALPWRAPVLLTAHSCVLSWWSAVKSTPIPEKWNRYREEVERSLKSVDLITAPSGAMLQTLEENYGGGLPACRVVPNGRAHTNPAPRPKEPIVLSAGRVWDEAKNFGAVARVAPGLPWPVYIAGETSHPDGVITSLDGCRYLGRLAATEIVEWFARASIYALPARYEPFGLSALEAALSGCALVLGDIPSLRETWGNDAVFVSTEDDRHLETALRELMENHEKREALAQRSHRRARQFTPARMACGYTDAYAALAHGLNVA